MHYAPFKMNNPDNSNQILEEKIHELIRFCGGAPENIEGDLIAQQIQTSLRLMSEGHHLGQLKLITRSLKEMRYAYRIFNQYPKENRISIFGSARTPETHPDYSAAKLLSETIAQHGWMCITGAANGIMKAGMEGQKEGGNYGLSIRLPFEEGTNSVIEGDPKLINFRYFFTRKLMFMSHSNAIAVFPGGFGTQDELFEMLTLMQTGKAHIIPVILFEGGEGVYWHHWENYVQKNLLKNKWISDDDKHFYHIASSIKDGVDHILKFYRRYHSSRYVQDDLVIRLKSPLTEAQVAELSERFAPLIQSNSMYLSQALPQEKEFPDLPRLVFTHTKKRFGLVRALIDAINEY